jgi:hypothetical protein
MREKRISTPVKYHENLLEIHRAGSRCSNPYLCRGDRDTNLSAGHDSIAGVLLVYLYLPTIWLIGALGNFRGESAMINPILYGVPLGILIYGIITGAIFRLLKRGSKPT